MYGLNDPMKRADVRDILIYSINKLARELTQGVKAAGGYTGIHVNEGTKNQSIIDAKYSRGFEHVMDPDWDGKVERRFTEVVDIKQMMTYGFQRQLYRPDKVEGLIAFLSDAKAHIHTNSHVHAGPGSFGDGDGTALPLTSSTAFGTRLLDAAKSRPQANEVSNTACT